MKKIIFINRYFYPDHSATSHMLSDLAFGLANKLEDAEIHIVTSRQRYDDSGAQLDKDEIINKVHVHRIWTSHFGRQNLLGRFIDYLSFYFTSALMLLKITKKNDVVVAKTDPPLISLVAAVIAKLKRADLVNWIQDLFPEVAAELGVKFVSGVPYKILKKIRNVTLNQATVNIVIGSLMGERLQKEGVPKEKIAIIHNWIDEDTVNPISHDQNTLRKSWGLEDKFVVGYSGNFGRSHDFLTIISAAIALKNNNDIRFLFVGGGAQLMEVKQECLNSGLDNVIFKPYQPRNKLAENLSVPDVHLISLKPELEGLIVPSKFYGILAVGRPVIFLGSNSGELSKIINDQNYGQVVLPGDNDHLISVVIQELLKTDRAERSLRIRKLFNRRFTKTRAINEFVEVFNGKK